MNHPQAKWTLFALAILAGLSASDPAWSAPDSKPKDKVFVGYLFGQPRDIPLNKMITTGSTSTGSIPTPSKRSSVSSA